MNKFFHYILILLFLQPCFATTVKKRQAVAHVKHTTKHVKKAPTKTNLHHKKTIHKKLTHKKPIHKTAVPNDRRNLVDVANIPAQPQTHVGFFASMEHKLVNYVHYMVHTLRYSSYKMGGTNFDVDRGVYIVDCSDYVDRILENVYPDAYMNLLNNTGTDKPTSAHYFDFFNNLSYGPTKYWNKIEDVEDLKAGDILVFRNQNRMGRMGGGHVMVVMDKAVRDDDVYFVKVTDSAPSGHSEDTRPQRVSGIGIGTLMLRINPRTGQPSAYAWKVGARWKSNVKIAMARPTSFS